MMGRPSQAASDADHGSRRDARGVDQIRPPRRCRILPMRLKKSGGPKNRRSVTGRIQGPFGGGWRTLPDRHEGVVSNRRPPILVKL